MKFLISVLCIVSAFSIQTFASSLEQEKVKAHITQLDFMIGDWNIKNKIRQRTGEFVEKSFIVKSRYIFNDLAIESYWQDYLQPNNYVGTVIHTFEPKSELITTSFFNAVNSIWTQKSKQMKISQSEVVSTFNGKDGFGDFISKTVISIESKDLHRLETKRLYEGNKNWILIDSYTAQRIIR